MPEDPVSMELIRELGVVPSGRGETSPGFICSLRTVHQILLAIAGM